MKKLTTILLLSLVSWSSYSQCPTSGTISADCTSAYYTPSGDVIINPGVTVTITNAMTLNAGRLITATGATINAGSFQSSWGSVNRLTGGTYNVTGNFSSNSGGQFTMTGINATVGGNASFDGGGNNQTYINSSFSVAGSAYYGGGTHTINGTTFDIGTGYANPTGQVAWDLNGSATLNYTNNAVMDVRGDVNAGNSANINIDNSDVHVTGNFDNAGQGEIIVTNNGSFRVDGDYDNSGTGHTTVEDGGSLEVGGDFNNTGGGSELVEDGGAISIGGTYSGNAPNSTNGGNCGAGGGGCCGPACGSLPVSLTFFEATLENNHVVLQWETASELNNDHFNIHRSQDGSNFEVLGSVEGNGTTNEVILYNYEDNTVKSGTYFYKLEQVDYDGMNEFFETKRVDVTKFSKEKLDIYPLPVASSRDFYSSRESVDATSIKAVIVSLSGRQSYDLTYSVEFDRIRFHSANLNLSPGIYVVKIASSKGEFVSKIVVSN